MPAIFCFYCWCEFSAGTARCPSCGRVIDDRLPFRGVLERALSHPRGPTAERAAYLLGRVRDPASIPALSRALDEGDPAVAAEVVLALSRIGTPEAQSLVERAMNHRHETVRSAARRTWTGRPIKGG